MANKSRETANLVSDNVLFVDATNNSLGIGTDNPAGQLNVRNGPVIIGSATSTGTANQNLQVTGKGYFSQFVGIGTTVNSVSSAELLEVNGSNGGGYAAFISSSTTIAPIYAYNYDTTASINIPYITLADNSANRGGIGVLYGDSAMWMHGQGGIRFRYGGTTPGTSEALRIDLNGNVGIATTNPVGLLNVGVGATQSFVFKQNGGVGINTTNVLNSGVTIFNTNRGARAGLYLNSDHDAGTYISIATQGAGVGYIGNSFNVFGASSFQEKTDLGIGGADKKIQLSSSSGGSGNAPALQIDTSERVGIGTTIASAKLDVVSVSPSEYIAEFRQRSASNSAQIIIDSPSNGTSRPVLIDLARAGTVQWSIGQGYLASNDRLIFATSSLAQGTSGEQVAISTTGNIVFKAGGGLDFSANSNSAGSQAELFNDYERGTWTPTIISTNATNPSLTYSGQSGLYVKISELVYIEFLIIVSAVSSQGTGNIGVGGLPFASQSGAYRTHIGLTYNDTWDVDFRNMYASGSTLQMVPIGVTQSNASYGTSNVSTGYFSGAGFYYCPTT